MEFRTAETVSMKNVKVHDSFFTGLMKTTVDSLIPYQWRALNDQVEDADPSYCIANFKLAAGIIKDGIRKGMVFQDSDLAKWIEAASFSLIWNPDPALEKDLDDAIELIGKAQMADGYLDTYYQCLEPDKRWTNLRDNHELYCAGHMLEAAVAFYKATGKKSLLDIMCRNVDHIMGVIGPEEGKLHGYPGHEVLEMALCKLYEVNGDKKYLNFAKYLVDERGKEPNFFVQEGEKRSDPIAAHRGLSLKYYQADRPVRQHDTAEGHAVRAGYLYSGMADVARLTGDEELRSVCRRLFENIARRQMYITGAVGQSAQYECYTFDYDLPNDLVYGETCASIAVVFFAQRMLQMEQRGLYADVMEREFYNGTISGMSLDGTRFFYVNPLQVLPKRCENNLQFRHVKPVRQKWFGCACCPPNLGRLMASMPDYIYVKQDNTVFMSLYTTNDAQFSLANGDAAIRVKTDYPWNGRVVINIDKSCPDFQLALHLPEWCNDWSVKLNGKACGYRVDNGYIYPGFVNEGDELVLDMDMPVRLVRANPLVEQDVGKIAVTRGPVVYCIEEADNGDELQSIYLAKDAKFDVKFEPELLGGVVTVETEGYKLDRGEWKDEELYSFTHEPKYAEKKLRFIPYYAWTNREPGEMTVWVHEKF